MPHDNAKMEYTWPKPWLQQLYEQAINEGCIRIKLRAEIGSEEIEDEWKSFKASFLRMRRRRDAANAMMDPRFQYVSLRFERHIGRVLIIYSALPDDQTLPTVEAVDGKRELPQPIGSRPRQTPEEDVGDFDPTAHVAKLIDNLEIAEDDEDGGRTDLG